MKFLDLIKSLFSKTQAVTNVVITWTEDMEEAYMEYYNGRYEPGKYVADRQSFANAKIKR